MSKKVMTGITLTQPRSITAPSDATSEGDSAANVFERFDRGASPDEVVTALVLPVETVECLWRTWARLRGVAPMSPEALRALRGALSCNLPLSVAAEVVEAVRRFVERPPRHCTRCKAGCPEFCTSCPGREANKARRRTRAAHGNRNGAESRAFSEMELPGAQLALGTSTPKNR
jgi:hypothetical protein